MEEGFYALKSFLTGMLIHRTRASITVMSIIELSEFIVYPLDQSNKIDLRSCTRRSLIPVGNVEAAKLRDLIKALLWTSDGPLLLLITTLYQHLCFL